MYQRAVLAAGGGTLTDTMHVVWALVTVLLMTTAMGFGAAAFAKRFSFRAPGRVGYVAGRVRRAGDSAPEERRFRRP